MGVATAELVDSTETGDEEARLSRASSCGFGWYSDTSTTPHTNYTSHAKSC